MPLQISYFLCKTNPILSAVGGLQMNVNSLITMNYEKFLPLAGQKNKPNSNPIKACPERSRMGQSLFLPLLQDLYIIYPLHSLPSIALAKEGQSKEKPAYKGDYE
jgi:hypothetical protein